MSVLLQLVHGRIGAVWQWIIGLFIGWATSHVVALGIEMPSESWQALQVALEGIGVFIVTFSVQFYQARQAVKIQSAAGVETDSWIGPDTVEAVEKKATKQALRSVLTQ